MKLKSTFLITSIVLGGMASFAFASVELAKVNGKSISDNDLILSLSGLNEGQRANILKDSNTKRQILNSVIDQEVLVQEAEKQKLDQDQEYKDALVAFQKQYLSSKVLQRNLSSRLTDSAAKKFYDQNKNTKYNTDRAHVMHILVADEEQAKDLAKKAKAGADFRELAEKFSKDTTVKRNGGDLGTIDRSRMDLAFTNAAFGGKAGEIVGPVKTSYGYHVIKIIDKKLGKALEYSDVELRVKSELRNQMAQEYIGKLRAASKIQVNDKSVDKL